MEGDREEGGLDGWIENDGVERGGDGKGKK